MKKSSIICFIAFLPAIGYAQLPVMAAARDSAAKNVLMQTFAPSGVHNKVDALIPQNYYTQHLGFFCRQELKMQQAKVPVTFRVGSMDDCNRLEQKPGYR